MKRIDDTLDTLSGSTWFSTLIQFHPDDKEKTASSIGTGMWHIKGIDFCNALATFERLLKTIWKTGLVFLDLPSLKEVKLGPIISSDGVKTEPENHLEIANIKW